MPNNINVAVIVDHLEHDKRRTCFWPDELKVLKNVDYELVNLLDLMVERVFFDIYKYDVVIFNWCVLDGSVMYESDRLQKIIKFYESHFHRFVSMQSGIVIVENQPKRWHPEQTAYDVLFSNEIKVLVSDNPSVSNTVVLSKHHRKHPLLNGLPDKIKSIDAYKSDWFPIGSTSSYSLKQVQTDKMYSGAFKSWSSEWIPLLYTEDNRYPVMLVKCEGNGIWIATTMFIASSSVADLVHNLICVSKGGAANIHRYHHDHEIDMKRDKLVVMGGMVFVGLCLYFVLKNRYWAIDIPYGNTIVGNFILNIAAPIVLAGMLWFVKPIWNRLQRMIGLFRW